MREASGKRPPCERCMPKVREKNVDAFRVWSLVRNQVILSGMGDEVDIRMDAVKMGCEVLGVRNWKRVTVQVMEIARAIREARKEKEEDSG
jgi:hypothetical protein